MNRAISFLIASLCFLQPVLAEDWPEWRGKGRNGVWTESGIVDKFPEKGLTPVWRTPVHAGFAGPAVAAGRVFVTDFERLGGTRGKERALCLDENSGKIVWIREWDADYRGISYDMGPRATPTVDADRTYIVGASGKLLCLSTRAGDVIWEKDYAKDVEAKVGHGHAPRRSLHLDAGDQCRRSRPDVRSDDDWDRRCWRQEILLHQQNAEPCRDAAGLHNRSDVRARQDSQEWCPRLTQDLGKHRILRQRF